MNICEYLPLVLEVLALSPAGGERTAVPVFPHAVQPGSPDI